jgi:hypothetical protein
MKQSVHRVHMTRSCDRYSGPHGDAHQSNWNTRRSCHVASGRQRTKQHSSEKGNPGPKTTFKTDHVRHSESIWDSTLSSGACQPRELVGQRTAVSGQLSADSGQETAEQETRDNGEHGSFSAAADQDDKEGDRGQRLPPVIGGSGPPSGLGWGKGRTKRRERGTDPVPSCLRSPGAIQADARPSGTSSAGPGHREHGGRGTC